MQLLTGHGCFGRYLHGITWTEPAMECHHYDCNEDTVEHTLAHGPAWLGQRRVLVSQIRPDLLLPTSYLRCSTATSLGRRRSTSANKGELIPLRTNPSSLSWGSEKDFCPTSAPLRSNLSPLKATGRPEGMRPLGELPVF